MMPLDVSLKHQDSDNHGTQGLSNIAKLVISGLEDEPDEKHFPLVQAGPRLWKVEGFIEL